MTTRILTALCVASAAGVVLLLVNPRGAATPGPRAPELPVIPDRSFTITDYGATGDGRAKSTAAIRDALAACAKAGGGRVVVPAGTFVSGPVRLGGRTELHLAKGAVLRMSPDAADFPATGGTREAFVSADNAAHVQISGEGTIDGQGEPWWVAFRTSKAAALDSTEPRRPQLIQLSRCDRVRLTGFKTLNPPNTHCSLRDCTEVTVEGLTLTAPADSPNTDGLNLKVRNAVVRNCTIATGDDNIVLLASGAGTGADAGVANVVVKDCKLGVGHGLSVGSFTSGGVRNVVVDGVAFDGTTSGIRMKSARGRGGPVEHLAFKNITMKDVKRPIFLSSYYPKEPKRPDDDTGGPAAAKTPLWRDITIENATITGATEAAIIWGLPEQPMTDITLRNVRVSAARGAVVYHAKGIRFENVDLSVKTGQPLVTYKAAVEGMTSQSLEGGG